MHQREATAAAAITVAADIAVAERRRRRCAILHERQQCCGPCVSVGSSRVRRGRRWRTRGLNKGSSQFYAKSYGTVAVVAQLESADPQALGLNNKDERKELTSKQRMNTC